MKRFAALTLALALSACATAPSKEPRYEVTSFENLNGWMQDKQSESFSAFRDACVALLKLKPDNASGPEHLGMKGSDWVAPCAAAAATDGGDDSVARAFFTTYFTPVSVIPPKGDKGLFTGYYEIALEGSRTQTDEYRWPVYAVPRDLVTADLSEFHPNTPEFKGKSITGRVVNGKVKPYLTSGEIRKNGLPEAEIIGWAKDPVALYFLHIQGSGRLLMPDGSELPIGFAGKNGKSYRSVGKVLIEQGVVPREKMTAPALQEWMRAQPDHGIALMNENESFVFFRELSGRGPIGALGVPLTAGRSLAVDRTYVPLGSPIWLETTYPEEVGGASLKRLMVAQDTGGAIKGAVRGDVFWGYGNEAEELANFLRSPGSYTLLLPKSAAARL